MKDSYVNAKLVEPNLIRLVIFSSLPFTRPEPTLVKDRKAVGKLIPSRVSTLSSLAIIDFRLENDLELGHSYFLVVYGYGILPLDVTEATGFPDFDLKYYYDGDDLGCTYTKKRTSFVVWAPLASSVNLLIRKEKQDGYDRFKMNREDKGIYRLELDGNYENYRYLYEITNNETTHNVTDIYAKASTLNGKESVVLDFKKIKVDSRRDCLPILNSPTDAIIYECHVRDMTIDGGSDIVNKGTFKGLAERGRTTEGGHPAGFDYIKSLGITHLQLLPIYDYKTVNEEEPDSSYNWGYDPQQYFVPEGSFGSKREDPTSRIRDLKEMVAEFHKEGIRIVMDVVYNHVFEYETSIFERVVPNYFFRKRYNGTMANTSGCGNDLASERPMVRKLIVDACKWWIDEYSIDGFRFDLMGIITVDCLNEIKDYARSVDKNFLLYGEGWNMGGDLAVPLGHMGNFAMLQDFAFFNDHFRECTKRYLTGDTSIFGAFKHAFVSSSLHYILPAKFLNANQTINYVECHDNATFYDYIDHSHPDWSVDEKLDICKLGFKTVLYSFGIPFIHMGQEIGQSKWGEDNTYNKGDRWNKFSYSLLDKRYDMVEEFMEAVEFRKKTPPLHFYDPRVIESCFDIRDYGMMMNGFFHDPLSYSPYKNLSLFLNPTFESMKVTLEGGEQIKVAPRSTYIISERGEAK